VGAGEEHLLDIGRSDIQAIDLAFVLVNLAVRVIGLRETTVKGWDELYTAFVESQRVTEMGDGIVRTGERQVFWNPSDRFHGVPSRRYEVGG